MGSNDGCPPEAPICSEYGYCQCSTYKTGGPACGPGIFDEEIYAENNSICGTGKCWNIYIVVNWGTMLRCYIDNYCL